MTALVMKASLCVCACSRPPALIWTMNQDVQRTPDQLQITPTDWKEARQQGRKEAKEEDWREKQWKPENLFTQFNISIVLQC